MHSCLCRCRGSAETLEANVICFCRQKGNSDILKITLPRPMGLIFEENRAKGQAVIADFVKGSEIEKRAKVSEVVFCTPAQAEIVWHHIVEIHFAIWVGDKCCSHTCTSLLMRLKSWPNAYDALVRGSSYLSSASTSNLLHQCIQTLNRQSLNSQLQQYISCSSMIAECSSIVAQCPLIVLLVWGQSLRAQLICRITDQTRTLNHKNVALCQVAKLNQSWKSVPQKGDVLRACTCTNMVYASQSLFGAKAPVRTIVVYGADNQKWPKVQCNICFMHAHNALKTPDCCCFGLCSMFLIHACMFESNCRFFSDMRWSWWCIWNWILPWAEVWKELTGFPAKAAVWPLTYLQVIAALRAGDESDGDVTLVLERQKSWNRWLKSKHAIDMAYTFRSSPCLAAAWQISQVCNQFFKPGCFWVMTAYAILFLQPCVVQTSKSAHQRWF